jgi:hypothetical protein
MAARLRGHDVALVTLGREQVSAAS